ncbi:MAG: outer membrane protein assembly factor BamD [Marinifilaceae bacterium]|jgi:outer membrane protein assembly factor BamD|nr:outer membrane protein assembly factor BamD [Marinifilaceae bacterium]
MKHLFFYLLGFIILLSSCSEYQKLLKSDDNELKFTKAKEYYNSEDYAKAATLFQEVAPVYRGTSKAETIAYYIAYCAYGQNDPFSAGHYFRSFLKTYPDSPFAEECLYMSAYCYYMESPKPRLDQTPTNDAIEAFQLYINRYPRSTRIEKCNTYIDEMQDKLVFKSYLTAKNYYDREYYPSAIIALQNSIKDYPGSKYRENLMCMLLESKYKLAENSVIKKKRERYNLAKEEYYSFINEYKEGKFRKNADKMLSDIDEYLNKFMKKDNNEDKTPKTKKEIREEKKQEKKSIK